MTRRRRKPFAPTTRIELTPMIDVTFLILIFFMCTIQFRSLDARLESHLPRDVGQRPHQVVKPDPARIVVRVLEPGRRLDPERDEPWQGSGPWRHGPDRRLRYDIGPRATTRLDGVRDYLSTLLALDQDLEVVVDARPGTTYADVVGVVDSAHELGCASITFAAAR